jgi:spermidine synthase
VAVLVALFFLSGCAGLIYEVVWTRMLADIVGSTAISMTVVFSVFLAGLAAGAWAFARVRVRGAEALRLYARMAGTTFQASPCTSGPVWTDLEALCETSD